MQTPYLRTVVCSAIVVHDEEVFFDVAEMRHFRENEIYGNLQHQRCCLPNTASFAYWLLWLQVPLQGLSCPSLAMSRESDWLAARNTSCKPSELQRLVPSPTKINRASQDFGHMGHPVAPLPGSSICLVGAAVVVSRYRLLSFFHHIHYKTLRLLSCKTFHSFDISLWCCRPDTGFSM